MKRLSFFALTSLVLAGACFDVQAGKHKNKRQNRQENVFVINEDVKKELQRQEAERSKNLLHIALITDEQAFVQLPLVPVQLPFLKRHEKQIKQAGAVLGGLTIVAAAAYAVKHPQEAKQKLQAAGNKAIEVGGKVVGVVAQGADKLANVAGSALNAAKDRMPFASTVVNAVRNRMPSSSSLPSLSSLNPFKK